MTLDEAIYKLGTMAAIVRIAGVAATVSGEASTKRWRVEALMGPGHCYPPFCDDDDLLTAICSVIGQIEARRAQGRSFVEANPELKALPVSNGPTLFPRPDEN